MRNFIVTTYEDYSSYNIKRYYTIEIQENIYTFNTLEKVDEFLKTHKLI